MSMAELFRGKILLIHAPEDVSEVIYSARFIPIAAEYASDIVLMLSDTDGLAELIQTTFPALKVIAPDSSSPLRYDIELDLVKLPFLFINERHRAPIRYLNSSPEILSRFYSLMDHTGLVNIGLALYGSADGSIIDSLMIARNITMNQRHKSQFYFIPADPNQSESKPPFSNFQDVSELIHNYSELAGLLASLDIIISFENDVAHLAAALGKAVWLLIPHSTKTSYHDLSDVFSNVTSFRQPPSGDWGEVIQNTALFRFLQPERLIFKPFLTEDMILEQPAALPFPVISFENTSQLPKVLDANLAVFTSVAIETTTVCNLKCSYCPHSTDMAKPPALMPDEMFFKIIDSLHEYVPSYSGSITPSMYGEPLLDTRIESLIRYAKNRFPQARIEFFTNGDFLTPEKFFSLREAGVDHYNISQHTPNRSQALSDTLATVTREIGEELPITFNKMLEQNKFNRGGLVDVEMSQELYARQSYCLAAYQNLSFDYKGDALLCCNDYQAKHTFGNISSKSVRDIWADKAYRQARNMLMLGFLPFPICRVCMQH